MAEVGGGPTVLTAEQVAANTAAIELLTSTVDVLWIINGSIFVFFMQTGFAFLEAGSVRAKNTKNILLKNLIDTSLGALMWYAVGYAFSYGDGNAFIGASNFFLVDFVMPSSDLAFWLYSNAFAATAATIVSGALAERCRFQAYAVYTACITGFIYPTANHWVNSTQGWLSRANPDRSFPETNGLLDFASSGVVHLVGGMCALVGCLWLGPRKGRFNTDGTTNPMPGHSTLMAAMGTMILWTAWYGFNSVSTQKAVGQMHVAALTTVNTTLCAAVGGITSMFLSFIIYKALDVTPCLNGILSGLVASSSICAYVDVYAAVVVGIVAGALYVGCSKLMLKLKVDDPLDVVPVHLVNGALSLFMAGLFATPYGLEAAEYPQPSTSCGAFYGCGGQQLKVQVVGILVLGSWAAACAMALFAPLSLSGALRVSTSQEMEGLDVTFHGGTAYNFGTNYDGKAAATRNVNTLGSMGAVVHSSLRGGNMYPHASMAQPGSFTRQDSAAVNHQAGASRNPRGSREVPARPIMRQSSNGANIGTTSADNTGHGGNAALSASNHRPDSGEVELVSTSTTLHGLSVKQPVSRRNMQQLVSGTDAPSRDASLVMEGTRADGVRFSSP
mmetsp:Transcript_48667/g.122907  ORF Transcript_48667/g.122907 Transcript_48667/m.122907 type:complete len:615 (+) Transcript_48667:267-2111(+)